MPYLNCPACRLTVYNPPTIAEPERCPRCRVELGEAAPSLFRSERPARLHEELERTLRDRAEERGPD
jgi:hypothetical protein